MARNHIAFAGLGQMGGPLAERLRGAGYEVKVFDVLASVRAEFAARGFEVAESLDEAASGAEVFLMCLPDAEAVESAVLGERGLLHAGPLPAICVDLTSSLPSTTVKLGEVLGNIGVKLLDAPLSGGVTGAREGTLTVMMGGDPAVLEQLRPLLSVFASNLLWAGGLGAGHAVKAINNALSATAMAATAEAVAASLMQGIPVADCVHSINQGLSRSQNSEVKYPRYVLSGTFDMAFSIGLCHKDVRGACLIAAETGTPVPVMASVREILASAAREFGPRGDFTRVHEMVVKGVPFGGASRPRPAAERRRDEILAVVNRALLGILILATQEAAATAKAAGLDLSRALSIYNLSSGRNECTRAILPELLAGGSPETGSTVAEFLDSLALASSWAGDCKIPVPLVALAHELWTGHEKELGAQADGAKAFAAAI
jgi:3-hydroxyisobutyrate dehydrogenase